MCIVVDDYRMHDGKSIDEDLMWYLSFNSCGMFLFFRSRSLLRRDQRAEHQSIE